MVFGSRFAFELSHIRAPEPDVAFVSIARLHLVEETRMKGAPDIAVEIVARESRSRDYFEKKNLYESAGVLEYCIIDPLQLRAEFYRLLDGRYHLVPLEQNRIFRSEVLEGFGLDVEWLFADNLPNEFEKRVNGFTRLKNVLDSPANGFGDFSNVFQALSNGKFCPSN